MSDRAERTGEQRASGEYTVALHAGQAPDPATGAMAVPLYQTAAFAFKDFAQAAARFGLKEAGMVYGRLTNPTEDVFEKRMAAIEGGVAALAVASGQAAITYALLAVTRLNDHIVSGNNLYGGTYQLFHHTFPKLGRTATFVDSSDVEAFRKAVQPNTRAIYIESIGNPKLDVPDFAAIAAVAHENKIPLIVDNTVGVGLVRPIDYGADIVVESATKYIGGHGTSLGGVIVDSGNFDWGSGKFPEFTEPDPSYHGIQYWQALGRTALATKIRVTLLRDTGATISPFNARDLLLGTETLPLRVRRHAENALALAQWLQQHPRVAWVNYPGLSNHPSHATAVKYLKHGFGGLIGFGVKGGFEACRKFIDHLQLATIIANIGDAKTMVIHPASTTHQQLTEAEQAATGVTPDFIRFSAGLEDVADIESDLDQALAASSK